MFSAVAILAFFLAMVRGRVPSWKAQEPSETALQLGNVVQPFVSNLVSLGDSCYPSTSFAAAEANEGLLDGQRELLSALRLLDPRGSYFAGEDMTASLRLIVDAEELWGQVQVHAALLKMSSDEFVSLLSLKVRVMCAHDRARTPGLDSSAEPRKKQQRKHPFKFFQDVSDEEEEEDEKHLVLRHFDGKVATQHYSDGTRVPALSYRHGEAGMVVAVWEEGEFELEVPNSCLIGQDIVSPGAGAAVLAWAAVLKKPSAPRKKPAAVLKRPAAAVPEPLLDEPTAEAEGDMPAHRLKVRGGHDGAQCLFLETKASDRAQVLSVSLASANAIDKQPDDIIDHIRLQLLPLVEALPAAKVADLPAEALADIRSAAKRHRLEALSGSSAG